ncbi:hypothetical protein C0J52_05157 [Blattella germanica]|nr:hypothetical protein C0J52_05157 [Blattella germanica]
MIPRWLFCAKRKLIFKVLMPYFTFFCHMPVIALFKKKRAFIMPLYVYFWNWDSFYSLSVFFFFFFLRALKALLVLFAL